MVLQGNSRHWSCFYSKRFLNGFTIIFNSTGIIFDYANQSGIEDLDDLEKAKDSLGF